MAITLKSRKEIELLHAAGQLVAETFALLREHVRPGVSTGELDRRAEEFILKHGAEPVYKGYVPRGSRGLMPFPGTICASVNDVICHGIPDDRQLLKDGDVIGIDIGVRLKGWVGDSCVTFAVGSVDERTQHLLDTTQRCLQLGIEQAQAGKRLGDIGASIQQHAEGEGFSLVREYTGHGVGRKLHEEPTVLHYGTRGTGQRLISGMVFTIEPMINAGSAETRLAEDGWTVRTDDGARSAQYEHTIVVTDNGPLVLTRL
ncbi:MAG: type I methionyl aminopeptidase [Herpetosiphon sp.]